MLKFLVSMASHFPKIFAFIYNNSEESGTGSIQTRYIHASNITEAINILIDHDKINDNNYYSSFILTIMSDLSHNKFLSVRGNGLIIEVMESFKIINAKDLLLDHEDLLDNFLDKNRNHIIEVFEEAYCQSEVDWNPLIIEEINV